MRLEKRKYYRVNYTWYNSEGDCKEEVDCGFDENELEEIVMNIITWVKENDGFIDILDIEFTEYICFVAVDDKS